ncbi:MAG: carbamate kinase [Gaiellaceae bacterium]
MTAVVALGGNSLLRAGDRGTAAEQLARLRTTAAALQPLLGEPLVLTHGNGPQVGNELVRQERAADEVPPLPLYLAVAQTQAEVGALAAAALRPFVAVSCLLTHVVVAAEDEAFDVPSKPIGPFYDEATAARLREDRGWPLEREDGRGWRRVVASPRPLRIVELEAVRALLTAGQTVIACGGGGIPVVERGGALAGVDAVVDKDWASAVLAIALGADRLFILTDVDAVHRNWGTPSSEPIRKLAAASATALAETLPAGSMRPKLAATAAFAETGGEALITSTEALAEALAGRAGTRVIA